jgi:hypothetical protein
MDAKPLGQEVNALLDIRLPIHVLDDRNEAMQSLDENLRRSSQGPQPRPMTPEEAAEHLPSVDVLAKVTFNCSRMSPADFEPYRGRFIAWGPEDGRIVSHAEDETTLLTKLDAIGINKDLCVIQYVDTQEDRF